MAGDEKAASSTADETLDTTEIDTALGPVPQTERTDVGLTEVTDSTASQAPRTASTGAPPDGTAGEAFVPFAVSGRWEKAEQVDHPPKRRQPPKICGPHVVQRTAHAVLSGQHETATVYDASGNRLPTFKELPPSFVLGPHGMQLHVLSGTWETAVALPLQEPRRRELAAAQDAPGTGSAAAPLADAALVDVISGRTGQGIHAKRGSPNDHHPIPTPPVLPFSDSGTPPTVGTHEPIRDGGGAPSAGGHLWDRVNITDHGAVGKLVLPPYWTGMVFDSDPDLLMLDPPPPAAHWTFADWKPAAGKLHIGVEGDGF